MPAFCTVCGRQLNELARFCPACGNSTTDSEGDLFSDLSDELHGAVDSLEQLMAPYGAVVLVENPAKRHPRRLEVVVDEGGRINSDEKARILLLLSELIAWDAYLHSEIAQGQKAVSCIWHIVGGEIIPLTAQHSSSLLSLYGSLWSSSPRVEHIEAAVDAPSIVPMD